MPVEAIRQQEKLSEIHKKLAVRPTSTLESELRKAVSSRNDSLLRWFLEVWCADGFRIEADGRAGVDTEACTSEPKVLVEQPALPKPVVEFDLAEIQRKMQAPRWDDATSQLSLKPPPVEALSRVGPPPLLDLEMSAESRANALNTLCEQLPDWQEQPDYIVYSVLRWAAAEHQGVLSALPVPDAGHRWRFAQMMQLAQRPDVKFVHGLSQGHHPKRLNWTVEATHAWLKLRQQLCMPHGMSEADVLERVDLAMAMESPEQIRTAVAIALAHGIKAESTPLLARLSDAGDIFHGKVFQKLRKALRRAPKQRAEPPTPPRDLTPEGRALMLGGNPRPMARQTLQHRLNLESLEWRAGEDSRLDATLRQIEHGAFDVVFVLLSLCSHRLSDSVRDTCRRSGVRHAPVTQGYGLGQVRRARVAAMEWAELPEKRSLA